MRVYATSLAVLAQLAAIAQGVRIIQGNDDGWAELYARSANAAFKAAGHQVILSAPAENKSGSGSNDEEPKPRTEPCQYNSCPANSGPLGVNATSPDLHWVNSFPVTALRYGIDNFVKQSWPQGADLAVTGPNVGSNIWVQVPFSGTVGGAVFAAKDRKLPSIAFSGSSSGTLAWNTQPVPTRSTVYAELATRLVNAVVAGASPTSLEERQLPEHRQTSTTAASQIRPDEAQTPASSPPRTPSACGSTRLPTETSVILRTDACYATVSIGDAADKTTASAAQQAPVIARLSKLTTCLP
ncbi:5'/3'-nucleotidase SurE family protein [Verticillium alfalfae VaMs.102]|uniref:5'/3'-nucleotidase SurE family protein n=1 Tax=Verticillium alfalfae (strain VaMs.102 / ATCC MYA-4576 / FGSC 10136) TaxID=526221 RepID=C9SXZ9_VERA1|nr:5'/3'-nucleotidase SurE family protein [Verticillium alfalfae VaMs.102]EEY23664.1 5'/3'-nucleotidase SurE family protein [Verticillium alfalfae VaMs.102]